MPGFSFAGAVEEAGADGRTIGELGDVIRPADTTPETLVIDFDDDAGFGDRDDVAVAPANFTPAETTLVLNADATAIASMPSGDD